MLLGDGPAGAGPKHGLGLLGRGRQLQLALALLLQDAPHGLRPVAGQQRLADAAGGHAPAAKALEAKVVDEAGALQRAAGVLHVGQALGRDLAQDEGEAVAAQAAEAQLVVAEAVVAQPHRPAAEQPRARAPQPRRVDAKGRDLLRRAAALVLGAREAKDLARHAQPPRQRRQRRLRVGVFLVQREADVAARAAGPVAAAALDPAAPAAQADLDGALGARLGRQRRPLLEHAVHRAPLLLALKRAQIHALRVDCLD